VSNTDSFIEEVNEEVRRERLTGYLRRYGWIAVVAVLGVVGGAAFTEYQRAQERSAAQAFGDALYAALQPEAFEERRARLSAVEAPEGGAPVRDLLIAAETVAAEGDPDAARAALERLATAPDTPPLYRDLANLRLALLPALSAEERLGLLDGLRAEGQPFAAVANELRALALIELGRTDEALEVLQGLVSGATTSPGQRQRAAQLVVSLGGTPNEG
jgi:hypothetical protein